MATYQFLQALAELLRQSDTGMMTFEEPLPDGVREKLIEAITLFGTAATLPIHEALERAKEERGETGLIQALEAIKDPRSIPELIAFHRRGGSFISSLAMIQAIGEFSDQTAIEYLLSILQQYCAGNTRVVETRNEIADICITSKRWKIIDAIPYLQTLIIQESPKSPIYEPARDALESLIR